MDNNIPLDVPALEQLNYFRNLYYTEGNSTERGIIANALNDILPYLSSDILEQLKSKQARNAKDVEQTIHSTSCSVGCGTDVNA